MRTTGEWWQTDVQSQPFVLLAALPKLPGMLTCISFPLLLFFFFFLFLRLFTSTYAHLARSAIFTTHHKQGISLASHEVVPLLGSSALRLQSHDASSASRADDPVGPRAGVAGKTQRAEVPCYRRIPFNPRLESGKVQFDIFQTTLRLQFRFVHSLHRHRGGEMNLEMRLSGIQEQSVTPVWTKERYVLLNEMIHYY